MADSEAFDAACTLLEDSTELTRLESRGTIRIALKQSGPSPRSVVASELAVVTREVLPRELESHGIPDAEQVCADLTSGRARLGDARRDKTPESVFPRLGDGK